MKRFDGKIAIPPTELQEKIVRHSRPCIFQLWCECDGVFRFQSRQVGNADSREMLVIAFLGCPTESTYPRDAGACDDDEGNDGNDEHEMVHDDQADGLRDENGETLRGRAVPVNSWSEGSAVEQKAGCGKQLPGWTRCRLNQVCNRESQLVSIV